VIDGFDNLDLIFAGKKPRAAYEFKLGFFKFHNLVFLELLDILLWLRVPPHFYYLCVNKFNVFMGTYVFSFGSWAHFTSGRITGAWIVLILRIGGESVIWFFGELLCFSSQLHLCLCRELL